MGNCDSLCVAKRPKIGDNVTPGIIKDDNPFLHDACN